MPIPRLWPNKMSMTIRICSNMTKPSSREVKGKEEPFFCSSGLSTDAAGTVGLRAGNIKIYLRLPRKRLISDMAAFQPFFHQVFLVVFLGFPEFLRRDNLSHNSPARELA